MPAASMYTQENTDRIADEQYARFEKELNALSDVKSNMRRIVEEIRQMTDRSEFFPDDRDEVFAMAFKIGEFISNSQFARASDELDKLLTFIQDYMK